MAKGGARSRSGPAPEPNALRRIRDDGDWITLPADGRPGDPPKFPLSKPAKRELTIWKAEWTRPQAIMWERNGQEVEVALYVRCLYEGEDRHAATSLRTLIVRMQEALGISATGLARNRWRIATAAIEPAEPGKAPAAPSTRDRFQVIAGGGG